MIIGYVSKQALALLFLFFGLTIAVIIKQLQKKFSFVPYTPTLFMISVALGYFAPNLGVIGESITTISHIDPRGILLIFLPPLIFEGAFNSDWYIFRKQAVQIFILAFPSVLVSAFIIMFSLKMIIGFDDSFFNYPEAFMFGSVLSCTDTVAVLALLKEAGAPKKFASLIQGESLFNDGTCMVLLTISLELVQGAEMQPLYISVLFLELTIGAIILGIIFGMISIFLIKLVKKDSILTINITVAMCYILYFVAQFVDLGIRISGIVALVSIGLYMAAFGKTKFTAEAKQKTHEFWKIFVFIAQTIIFILGGVVVGIKALSNDQLVSLIGYDEIAKLGMLYLCMNVGRFLSIAIFMPKLQNEGYGLKWIEVIALTYGGLRGAIGIAFCLILSSNEHVRMKTRIISLFLMAGCAFLTLLINGPTCGWVIVKIGLCKKSQTKVKLFKKFVKECVSDLERKVDDLQANKQLNKSNWDEVKKKSGLQQLKQLVGQMSNNRASIQLQKIRKSSMNANLLQGFSSDQIDPSLMSEIRSRYLIALKGIFWEKFEKNQCSGLSVSNLTECADLDLDNVNVPLNSWEYLVGHLHNPWFFPICFWFRKFPGIRHLAFSFIYDRVMFIYDIVSTYLEGLTECEQLCTMLPFDREVIEAVINESKINRKLAQSYLDKQVKVAYPEIMKRIQTAKAAHSLITYEKELLQHSYRNGQIDQQFYKQLSAQLEKISSKIENDSGAKEELSQNQTLMLNDFFMEMTKQTRNQLLRQKLELVFQKDEPIIKPYENQKFIYLVTRGEVSEEWKVDNNVIYKKSTKLYEIAGFSALWNVGHRQIERACTAESIVCMYCFPINSVKEIIMKNLKLENILYKEMLPLLLKVNPSFKLSITAQRWNQIKPYVTYRKVLKAEEIQVVGQFIVLTEGKIETQNQSLDPGFYDMTKKKVTIKGPARVFYCSSPFEEDESEHKTLGEYAMRGVSKNIRMSSQKRNTLAGGQQKSGALTRMLFTRDDE